MSSGRSSLATIDRSLAQARSEVRRVDAEMQRITSGMADLRRNELDVYRRLAGTRLETLEKNLIVDLDAADQRAATVLHERAARLAELESRIEASDAEERRLTQQREQSALAVERSELALDEKREAVQASLEARQDYRALADEAQSAVDVAAGAEQKAGKAEEDRREKGKPYESDPLFMYLWERQYGTSGYSAWAFARFVDGIVARHIHYEQARRNFYLLNEIPVRLRRHTENLERLAQEKVTALAEFERKAEISAGIETMETELAEAEQLLADIDAAIEQEEERFAALIREREQFANGTDTYYLQAIELLVSNFRAEPIPQLRLEAEATADYTDDALVRELGELRSDKRTLEQHVENQRQVHTRRLERLGELEAVRRRFKQQRYDSVHSIFDDRGNFEVMLGEFLNGLISADRLWRVIRDSQRFRRRMRGPVSGGIGGMRIPRMPRGVRIPRGMGGGGGFKIPRMPGGGGFRTKGGF